MSLKSRKDKGFGKVVEDEAAMMREVDTYRDDLGKNHYACIYMYLFLGIWSIYDQLFVLSEGGRRDDGTSKNPFHRAKKHIKTLISKGN